MSELVEAPVLPEIHTPTPAGRRVIRTADFGQLDGEDLAGMFGRWFEADHCDKE